MILVPLFDLKFLNVISAPVQELQIGGTSLRCLTIDAGALILMITIVIKIACDVSTLSSRMASLARS